MKWSDKYWGIWRKYVKCQINQRLMAQQTLENKGWYSCLAESHNHRTQQWRCWHRQRPETANPVSVHHVLFALRCLRYTAPTKWRTLDQKDSSLFASQTILAIQPVGSTNELWILLYHGSNSHGPQSSSVELHHFEWLCINVGEKPGP